MRSREIRACLKILAAVVIGVGLSSPAHAGTISLTPAITSCTGAPVPCLVLSGSGQGQGQINDLIGAAYPGLDGQLLYKGTQKDDAEEGAWATSYDTSYADTTLPDADATISWTGPSFIHADPVFALIKDGNLSGQTLTWYFYDITGWNGKDTIQFSGYFQGNQGKISHVSIYGTHVPARVPDGGSMAMLLGIALIGLAGARRMLK